MKNWIQKSTASIAMMTMILSPVAQGAAAKKSFKDNVNIYLKQTGLTTKKMTVGQFWKMVRHVYPVDMQTKLDQWVKNNENMPMPKITASNFKDGDGKNYVRLVLNQAKESHTLTFSDNELKALSLDNVVFSEKELLARKDIFEKANAQLGTKQNLIKNEKRSLTTREIARLPLKKQIEYFLKLREASEAAEKVLAKADTRNGAFLENTNGKLFAGQFENLLKTLIGEEAFANSWADGNSCIAAGWVATYSKGSCARPEQGRQSLMSAIDGLPFEGNVKSQAQSCVTGGGLPCNPILFGFSAGTAIHCVAKANVKYATRECNSKFPLKTNADKEKIIQSIVTAKNGQSLCKVEADGRTVPRNCMNDLGSYVSDLKSHYYNAAEFCTVQGQASTVSSSSWVTKANLKSDQVDACDNLKDRFFDLLVKLDEIPPPVVGEGILPGPSEANCAKENKNYDPETESCVCPAGQQDPKDPNVCLATKDDDAAGAIVPKEPQGPNWWDRNKNWAVPVGIGVIGLGIFWWLMDKDKKNNNSNNYVPPAPPPFPPASICESPKVLVNGVCSTPVVLPPSNPCPSPNQMVGGVCVPPVIVGPPSVPTSEGGTTTGTDGSAGGVR